MANGTPNLNSTAAAEERDLLGVTRDQQARSFAPAQPPQGLPPGYQPGDALLLAALIYGEGGSENDATMIMQGSTVLNRRDSGRVQEFGDTVESVIMSPNSPYYAAFNNTEQFQQAVTQQFPDELSERKFKRALQIANGLIRGTIPRHEGMFFFEGKEVSALKRSKKKKFDFKQVRETGKVGKYHTFTYK